jgi:hypothetical protein
MLLAGAAPPRATLKCPICEWTHIVREVRANNETLAGVFGFGVLAAIDANRVAEETEDALQKHLSGHTLIEWVARVSELEAQIRAKDQAIVRLSDALVALAPS